MTTPVAAEHMAAEISRLRVELEKANEQSEHFERQWYLRGDEIEALNAKLGEQQSVAEEWWPVIHDTLRNYSMTTLVDEEGYGYPLIEVMK